MNTSLSTSHTTTEGESITVELVMLIVTINNPRGAIHYNQIIIIITSLKYEVYPQ